MGQKNFVKWVIGCGVISVAVIATSFLNFGDNIVYFYTPQEALAKVDELTDKTIKVGALVKPGSVAYEAESGKLSFTLTDGQGHEINVNHRGIPPDMFKENQGVIVEGRMEAKGQQIVAQTLMVKHSEEYKKPDDHSTMNKALLEKSLFKNDSY